MPATGTFEETEHPRGDPQNRGRFTSKGEGKKAEGGPGSGKPPPSPRELRLQAAAAIEAIGKPGQNPAETVAAGREAASAIRRAKPPTPSANEVEAKLREQLGPSFGNMYANRAGASEYLRALHAYHADGARGAEPDPQSFGLGPTGPGNVGTISNWIHTVTGDAFAEAKLGTPRVKRDVTLGPRKLPKSDADVFVSKGVNEAKADAMVEKLYAGAGGTGEAYTALVESLGMPDDAKIQVTEAGKYKTLFADDIPTEAVGVRVEVKHPKLDRVSRFVGVDAEGKRFIKNEIIEVKKEFQKEGMGADIFAKQAEAASSEGFDYIGTHAAGGPGQKMNGYYTWPRFGYDQPLDKLPPDKLSEVSAKFPGAKSVLDVMATKEGRDWWKDNGTELTDAKFDLNPGSRSMRILAAYLSERATRTAGTKSKST